MSERINGKLVDSPALLRSIPTIFTVYPTQHDAKIGSLFHLTYVAFAPNNNREGRDSDTSTLASRGLTDQSESWSRPGRDHVGCALQPPKARPSL